MKLGEMLLRDGHLSPEQLDEAMAMQAKEGGRLGSILVEVDYINVETLTVYLGLELGMPIANGPTLERCKRSAVRLLTPQQAALYRCVPIVIQGQTLIVAIDDPHDLERLEAIHVITGYRVLPRVCPEIRIYYYLERFYGVPRPHRLRALGERARGLNQTQTAGLPNPPLPGLPPIRETAVSPPTPMPELRPATKPPENSNGSASSNLADVQPDNSNDSTALEIDANDLIAELDADDAETAKKAEAPAPEFVESEKKHSTDLVRPAALSLEQAKELVDTTQQRGHVAEALMAFAANSYDLAVLLLVRDQFCFGWRGYGSTVTSERLETLLIPLEGSSIIHTPAREGEIAVGATMTPGVLNDYICKTLRTDADGVWSVVPVKIGKRLVNVLLVKNNSAETAVPSQSTWLELKDAAQAGYLRLIKASKKTSSD